MGPVGELSYRSPHLGPAALAQGVVHSVAPVTYAALWLTVAQKVYGAHGSVCVWTLRGIAEPIDRVSRLQGYGMAPGARSTALLGIFPQISLVSMGSDNWCEGYWRGVQLAQDAWDQGGKEMAVLLTPILAFTEVTDWKGHEYENDEVRTIQQAIAPNVRAIHAYWLERRADYAPDARPVRRSEPRVGRNDPCPCGSGKKYKKCCLH
jgi:hypothetical protein